MLVGLAVAIKFFVWPVGLWLAATRRLADAALAAAVAACSLLLLLPFTSLHEYADALRRLGQVFDQDSYNVYGVLVQAGAPDAVARVAMSLKPCRRFEQFEPLDLARRTFGKRSHELNELRHFVLSKLLL